VASDLALLEEPSDIARVRRISRQAGGVALRIDARGWSNGRYHGPMNLPRTSRRDFLQRAAMCSAALALPGPELFTRPIQTPSSSHLELFDYGDVTISSQLHEGQLGNTHDVLMGLNEDGLMKPFREMSGLPASGEDLGGWYMYKPDYDYRKDSAGLCPGGTFGQWISALARDYAIRGDPATRDKVLRLNRLYAQSIGSGFFEKNRFPAYCYDKLVCGLIDSYHFAQDPDAHEILQRTTDLALPHLPPDAVDREQSWRAGKENDISYNWDESYTLPENLFLAYQRGAGDRYKQLAIRYLDDSTYFDPLAAGVNVFPGKHAYSYVNALNSALAAYLTLGSEKHLRAARNGFDMLVATQSFATGGWGPDEQLRRPGTGALAASLLDQHKSFETPCGAYAHFKLTRSLLRVTRDARYGDSMERVMYNTVLGAKPLQPDGTAFYYSDYSFRGRKEYSNHRWPCCSGTLPQVAADYRINACFHDEQDLYINLYLSSIVRWKRGGNPIQIQQTSSYPYDPKVRIHLTCSRAEEFTLRLRIPSWTSAASLSINGKRQNATVSPGTFAAIRRRWRSGDVIDLDLPMRTRLESIDREHPDIVALMYGPLVLFPIVTAAPTISGARLLAAKRTAPHEWQVETANGPLTLLPFTAITAQTYTTYLRVT